MERKRTKKHEGGGLYIAICCCILVIALIGYANNIAEKNREEEKFLAEQAGENIIANELSTPEPTAVPNPLPTEKPRNETVVTPAPASEAVAKAQLADEVRTMLAPVGGEVLSEFSADKQVYNAVLEDWRTHNGADIGAEVGDSVSAAADGVVSNVYMGALGYTVKIDHDGGLSTVYSNLDENPTVALGDNVKQGDVIGHIGNSALGDMCDKPHLHFEVLLDGEYKNPAEFLQ